MKLRCSINWQKGLIQMILLTVFMLCGCQEKKSENAKSTLSVSADGADKHVYVQGEAFSKMSGIATGPTSDVSGDLTVGSIDSGDWLTYSHMTFEKSGVYQFAFRVASPTGGKLQLETAGGGRTFATLDIPRTGGYETWTTVYANVQMDAGTYDLGIKAIIGGWNFNWFAFAPADSAFDPTIRISGNKFTRNGKQIFLNGANTPWQYQSDGDISFLLKNFDVNWWLQEFQKERNDRINVTRIWIHGTGFYTPATSSDGWVTAYPEGHRFWTEMDALVNAAAQNRMYLMPTFWSFDMTRDNTNGHGRYRQLIQDDAKIDAYINNFLIPFVKRYNSQPYVFAYDIGNEMEHMWRDSNAGKLSPYWVTRFIAKCAAAINQNTSKPVTAGSMWVIYNSNKLGSKDDAESAGWNRYTDQHLQQYFNSPHAYLDFYSPHWYGWQYDNGTSGPFERSPIDWIGSDDKPIVIGETFGGTVNQANLYITMADYYTRSFENGYAGVFGWRNTNYDDGYGSYEGIAQGTRAFHNKYPNMVDP